MAAAPDSASQSARVRSPGWMTRSASALLAGGAGDEDRGIGAGGDGGGDGGHGVLSVEGE
jgi:hypothetical protein